MIKLKQLTHSDGAIVDLEFVDDEELTKLHHVLNGIPASHKYHNVGKDGLFLHLVRVTELIQQTPVYKVLDAKWRDLITHMALYHDFHDKALFNKECYPTVEKYYRYYVHDVLATKITNINHPLMCAEDTWTAISQAKDEASNWIELLETSHHGFASKVYPILDHPRLQVMLDVNHFYFNFVVCLGEVGRCDTADAYESTAKNGVSALKVKELKTSLEFHICNIYDHALKERGEF